MQPIILAGEGNGNSQDDSDNTNIGEGMQAPAQAKRGIDAVADYSTRAAMSSLPAKKRRMQEGARDAAPPREEAEVEQQDEALVEMEVAAAGLANLSRESTRGGQGGEAARSTSPAKATPNLSPPRRSLPTHLCPQAANMQRT
mmetsp:Transcript_69749/g.220847  ORF Transcript_69749/g.220847 Transcript_69749/m.220847 type:complete len:143 (+) Transcript_69749:249-677(+)